MIDNRSDKASPAANGATPSRKRFWLVLGATICLLSWLALGAGILLGVKAGTMIVLATLAAVATEALVWMAALILGVSVYQMRRNIREKLIRFFRAKHLT